MRLTTAFRPRTLAIAALVALTAAAAPARRGPPWISIEYPGNPFDAESRGAFLYVHSFHHGMALDAPVSGTAEGLVGGARRSMPLAFTRTSRTGTYALRWQRPADGAWLLVISVNNPGADASDRVTALVTVGQSGVEGVTVPTTRAGGHLVPRAVAAAEVDDALRAIARRVASR